MRDKVLSGNADEEAHRRLRIEELSRMQLARRLHDGPIQAVAALALRAYLARRRLDSDPAAASDDVRELEELARSTTQDMRYLQFTLSPGSLQASGIDAALHDLVHQLDDLYDHKVQITLDPQADNLLSKRQQHQIFHIAVEALDNTRKHAQAGSVHLKLHSPEQNVLILEVEDDGIGFDPLISGEAADEEGKFGLAILRERVKLLHGELHIRSAAGSGTLLRVALPLSAGK
jgi:signal transduction histidine kinase